MNKYLAVSLLGVLVFAAVQVAQAGGSVFARASDPKLPMCFSYTSLGQSECEQKQGQDTFMGNYMCKWVKEPSKIQGRDSDFSCLADKSRPVK